MADSKSLQMVGWLFATLVVCVVTLAALSTMNAIGTTVLERQAASATAV